MSSEAWLTASQLVVAFGFVIAALGGYGAYYFGKRVDDEKALQQSYTGEIRSTEEVLVAAEQHVWPKIEFGDSGAILAFAGPNGTPLFDFGDDTKLTIVRDHGRVKVSLAIRDMKGQLVAELVRNEWKVNPHNSWDRNFTADALEVRDPSGDVVLQVKALADRIQLQAKFYDTSGRGLAFGKVSRPQGVGGALEMTGPNHPKLLMTFEPMFKYPSDKHFGELSRAGA